MARFKNIMWCYIGGNFQLTPTYINTLALDCVNNNLEAVACMVGKWITYGQPNYPVAYWATDSQIQNICTVMHQNGLKIYACLSETTVFDATYNQHITDYTAAVKHILGLGFDGYIDDIEAWTNDASILSFWASIATACHSMGKLSAVYYGINYPYTTETVILPNLSGTQDFLVIRFSPMEGNNSTIMYNEAQQYCSIPWLPQVREALAANEGETIQSSTDFYTKAFSNGIPQKFVGYTVWCYNDMAVSDWTDWTELLNATAPLTFTFSKPETGGIVNLTLVSI